MSPTARSDAPASGVDVRFPGCRGDIISPKSRFISAPSGVFTDPKNRCASQKIYFFRCMNVLALLEKRIHAIVIHRAMGSMARRLLQPPPSQGEPTYLGRVRELPLL
jgi:hypothetical protein